MRELRPDEAILLGELVRRGVLAVEGAAVAERLLREGPDDADPARVLSDRGLVPADAVAAAVAALAEPPPPEATEPRGGGGASAPEVTKPGAAADAIQGYRIHERLGRGGMGNVFRATQVAMGRVVALKVLRRPLAQDEQQVERLRREARLVGTLDHPNIVRGLDVGQSGPWHYFAMEFVDGETLRDRLQRGPVPEAEALRILERLCEALDHAHARGVVHRDVKPGNIILCPDGEPKLTDYGLAKGPSDFALTQSGVTIGTPQYISPEQARDPTGVDIQTDIYSLGATAYHMLAGVPPHTSDTLAGLLTKVLYEKPRTAQQVNPRLSREASFLVEKMMAKKKQHRYATPLDVLRDLRRIKAGRSIVPRNWSGDFEVQEVRRRARFAVAACVAVAAAGLGLTAWLEHRHEQETRRFREELAHRALGDIRNMSRRGEEALREYRDRLREFTRRHEGTEAAAEAEALGADVDRRLSVWRRARAALLPARDLADNRRFRAAMERIDQAVAELRREGGDVSEEPVAELARWRRDFQVQGQEAAMAAVVEELQRLESAPVGADTVTAVETSLRTLLAQITEEFVDREDVPAVQDLRRRLADLNHVRGSIDDALFGERFNQRIDAALAAGRFRDAAELLEPAGQAIASDAAVALLLVRVPHPVAKWYRGRVPGLLERVAAANREAVGRADESVRVLAAAGRHDEAVALLDRLHESSLDALRPEVERIRAELARVREEEAQGERDRIAVVRRDFLDDLARRDFLRARARVNREETDASRGPPRPLLAQVITACRLLLDRLENVAFGRVRAALRAGDGLTRGLRFDEEDRIPYDRVDNVRIEGSPTGDVVVFDAPGMPGIRRSLWLLSLPHLLHYARLDGPGLDFEDALLRGALVIAAGETQDVAAVEAAATLLVQARDQIPGVAPAVDALLERSRELVRRKLEAAEDLEIQARRYVGLVHDGLQRGRPKEARTYLDLLGDMPLVGTKVVREKKAELDSLRAAAQRMLNEQRLAGYYAGARVTERDRELVIELDFDTPEQRLCFVPPEDALPPLWDVRIDDPVPPATRGAGRVVFVRPPPDARVDGRRRELSDAPLAMELPFRVSQGVSIAMRVRWPERPLFFGVFIAGTNIGVLSDNERLEGGRGVWAWQGEDWRDAFESWPDAYRHKEIRDRGIDVTARYKDGRSEGYRHFQFEGGREYHVLIELRGPRIRLEVDGREIWQQELKSRPTVQPQRLRILTYTPMEMDDLVLRGVQDHQYVERLLRRR